MAGGGDVDGQVRLGMIEVEADPDQYRAGHAFAEDAAQLAVADDEVVRPFDLDVDLGRQRFQGSRRRQSHSQGERPICAAIPCKRRGQPQAAGAV